MFEGGAGEQAGLAVLPEALVDLVLAARLSFRPVGQQAAQDHQQTSQGPNERTSERVARPLQVQRRWGPWIQGDEAESGLVPEGALRVQLQPG